MMKRASSFYPYFAGDERVTVDKMFSFYKKMSHGTQWLLTDFLDPGQRDILKTIVGNDFFIQEDGGYEQAEKKRVYLSDRAIELSPADYRITAFEIAYPVKFASLNHSAILGTLANAGIELATFGDIITDGKGRWQFFGKSELTDFFTDQITRVGRQQVKLKAVSSVLSPQDDGIEKTIVASSLRLDKILAESSGQSRSQIKTALASNLVKLNWHGTKNSNIIVKVNDILSVRYFGRVKVMKIETTKKNKYRVVLKLWQTKK